MAEIRRVFEMTLERAALLAGLPAALGFDPVIRPDGFTHRQEGRTCTCRMAPMPPLRLGAFELERMRLEFLLEGYAGAEAEEFFTRFLRGFHRGGG